MRYRILCSTNGGPSEVIEDAYDSLHEAIGKLHYLQNRDKQRTEYWCEEYEEEEELSHDGY